MTAYADDEVAGIRLTDNGIEQPGPPARRTLDAPQGGHAVMARNLSKSCEIGRKRTVNAAGDGVFVDSYGRGEEPRLHGNRRGQRPGRRQTQTATAFGSKQSSKYGKVRLGAVDAGNVPGEEQSLAVPG